jgi:predicted nucleic acid-binding protein
VSAGPVYDAGALIAAERGDRRFARLHQLALQRGIQPVVPAAVLAQVWTNGSRQAQLARVLKGCEVESLDDEGARSVGRLRAAAGVTDLVDVSVVETAVRRQRAVVTSDPDDIARIAGAIDRPVTIERI